MTGSLHPPLVPLEQVIVFSPLGIRFWDGSRDASVSDGLVVRARPRTAPGQVVTARSTRTGVYAFFGLPRLRAIEYPPASLAEAGSPPFVERFVVDVTDTQRRFVPVAFQVDVPHLGVFVGGAPASPPELGPPGFYLFSAVTRTPPPTLAVVRAALAEQSSGTPAAHAVLELTLPDGRLEIGVADAVGQVVAIFPYPTFEATLASPPRSSQAALEPPEWPINVRARYAPGSQNSLEPSLPPDLGSLFAQATAAIWSSAAGPPVAELGATLVFGRELVLRTDAESTLLVG
jgi:hypothetical protein